MTHEEGEKGEHREEEGFVKVFPTDPRLQREVDPHDQLGFHFHFQISLYLLLSLSLSRSYSLPSWSWQAFLGKERGATGAARLHLYSLAGAAQKHIVMT